MEQVAHILSVLDDAISIGLALRLILSKGGGQLGQVSEILPSQCLCQEVAVLDREAGAVCCVRGRRMNGVAEQRRAPFGPDLQARAVPDFPPEDVCVSRTRFDDPRNRFDEAASEFANMVFQPPVEWLACRPSLDAPPLERVDVAAPHRMIAELDTIREKELTDG